MGLVLGICAAFITTVWLVVTAFAGYMSDSPTTEVSFWPTAVIGYGTASLLLASHFLHWGW